MARTRYGTRVYVGSTAAREYIAAAQRQLEYKRRAYIVMCIIRGTPLPRELAVRIAVNCVPDGSTAAQAIEL